MNPLARLLAAVVGAFALVGAFFFGFVILAVAAVIGLVLWVVIWLRIRWLRKTFEAQAGQAAQDAGASPFTPHTRRSDAIDAEYEVISREQHPDED